MDRELKLKAFFPVNPGKLYDDWLNSEVHSAFTGGKAEIDPRIGGKFSGWDGYLWGETLELEPGKKIVQSWRTSDFPKDVQDSTITIEFFENNIGTELQLTHAGIPDGQADDYETGWDESYFQPMTAFYSKG